MKILARLLAVAFIVFISIFALDVFGEGYGFWQMSVALFMHLLPSFILIAVTVLAWRRERWGGIMFIAFGVVSIFWFQTWRNIPTFAVISIIPIVIGVLFIAAGERVQKMLY
jgi:hypothetical protein